MIARALLLLLFAMSAPAHAAWLHLCPQDAAAAAAPAPRGVAVCQACHQENFLGAVQAEGMAAPRLAGQRYEYLVEAMRRFAEGERKNNVTMMQLMAGMLKMLQQLKMALLILLRLMPQSNAPRRKLLSLH